MRLALPIWNRTPAEDFRIDPELTATSVPKTLWIELTSKCPYDCVFCTRRIRWGAGRNLDFEIYRQVISELEAPDFIGLNYSGESIYYPRLLDAIRLAAGTGAATELVTAFSSIQPALLRGIVESGLDRLAISLHTMDAAQYQAIYGFGSLDLLKRRVADFLEFKAALGRPTPRLDFCFVAMAGNLDQLLPVAEYARSAGAPEISIHPIIGRHLVPHDFSRELAGSQLRPDFKENLRRTVEELRQRHPNFTVNVLNPDIEVHPRVGRTPAYFAPPLPEGARIHTCDQSPLESVHILANGDVVVCEVHDEVALGNLTSQTLRAIWTSERYRAFRRNHVEGRVPECQRCVWKQAYIPGPYRRRIDCSDGTDPQLLRGWHAYDGNGVVWSKRHALVALANPKSGTCLRIAGSLPPGPGGETNVLTVTCNGVPVGTIRNDSAEHNRFEARFPLTRGWEHLFIELSVSRPYRPSLDSNNSDSRDLGVALRSIEAGG